MMYFERYKKEDEMNREVPSVARQGRLPVAPNGAPLRRRALLRTAVSDIKRTLP